MQKCIRTRLITIQACAPKCCLHVEECEFSSRRPWQWMFLFYFSLGTINGKSGLGLCSPLLGGKQPVLKKSLVLVSLQTQKPAIMGGTSSKGSATNTSPTGAHGMQQNASAASREPIWPASCLMTNNSLWTVRGVLIWWLCGGWHGCKGNTHQASK